MYDKETWLDTDRPPVIGDRIEVIRGNGLREGETMGWATVTAITGDDIQFNVEPVQ